MLGLVCAFVIYLLIDGVNQVKPFLADLFSTKLYLSGKTEFN